jgi:SAM-dependent methyltransferase
LENDYAKNYSSYSDWHWWFQGRRRVIEFFLEKYVDTRSERTVAAVGGDTFEEQLLSELGDYYLLNHEFVLDESGRSDLGIKMIGKLPDTPFREGTFDLVCLFDVLEHIEDDQTSLLELERILSTQGTLLITVPALPFLWSEHDEINNHYRRYTYEKVEELVNDTRFEIIDWTYFNTFLFPIVVLLRIVQKIVPGGLGLGGSSSYELNGPGVVNNVLARIFECEAVLLNSIRFPFGASLLVMMRKN